MEIKKNYLEPEVKEKDMRTDASFLVSESSGAIEGGDVVTYDDDFWS